MLHHVARSDLKEASEASSARPARQALKVEAE
jgi:hypothetical protein